MMATDYIFLNCKSITCHCIKLLNIIIFNMYYFPLRDLVVPTSHKFEGVCELCRINGWATVSRDDGAMRTESWKGLALSFQRR